MARVYFDRLLEFSATDADPRPDLVIWPETSVPYLLERNPELADIIAAAAQGATTIFGIQREDGLRYFNSLVVLDPDGEVTARYDKHHLVPFGEYIPAGDLAFRLVRHDGLCRAAGQRLFRRARAAGPRPRPVRACAAADLLRGGLSAGPACRAGPRRLDPPDHQRRLVRHADRSLPALRPGTASRHRTGPAADPRGQYRRLGRDRREGPGPRHDPAGPGGLPRHGSTWPAAGHALCPVRRSPVSCPAGGPRPLRSGSQADDAPLDPAGRTDTPDLSNRHNGFLA